jgi:hypothetical protein
VNLPLLVAGSLALVGAAVHGGAGERLVLRELFSAPLPSTPFGGQSATRAMIRVTWHIVTVTFIAFGSSLEACGSLGTGDPCRGVGIVPRAPSPLTWHWPSRSSCTGHGPGSSTPAGPVPRRGGADVVGGRLSRSLQAPLCVCCCHTSTPGQ